MRKSYQKIFVAEKHYKGEKVINDFDEFEMKKQKRVRKDDILLKKLEEIQKLLQEGNSKPFGMSKKEFKKIKKGIGILVRKLTISRDFFSLEIPGHELEKQIENFARSLYRKRDFESQQTEASDRDKEKPSKPKEKL
jgi:hypothetical protein